VEESADDGVGCAAEAGCITRGSRVAARPDFLYPWELQSANGKARLSVNSFLLVWL
jgi:hypothetical protein